MEPLEQILFKEQREQMEPLEQMVFLVHLVQEGLKEYLVPHLLPEVMELLVRLLVCRQVEHPLKVFNLKYLQVVHLLGQSQPVLIP
jgi:hypothetical protein